MRTITKILFIFIAFSTNAYADCTKTSCTGVTVTRLYVTANGDTIISTSGDESKLTCQAGSAGYIRLNTNSKNYQATYALLLASHTFKHPIWVRMNGDTASCQLIYVVSDQ